MDIQSISVHIRYSKQMPDTSFKTVELGAEGTLAPGEDWHKAEVPLYHELGETMKTCSPATVQERLRMALRSPHSPLPINQTPPLQEAPDPIQETH
jgi:hypothetical protein